MFIFNMSSDIYFFIHYQRTQREDSDSAYFILPEDESKQPKCIFCYDEDYDEKNNLYNYNKIFKAPKSNPKGKYHFEFRISDDIYIIKFTAKKNTYVYVVDLVYGRKILDIRTKIPQNKIEYKDKIEYFIEALKKTGEEDKIKELLTDSFEIYKKNKGFCFLIPLFLKIYEKEKEEEKKDLLPKLLQAFREMNSDPKSNDKNLDRKKYLEEYKDDFEPIALNNLDTKEYNIIELYGIILCYLNFYDENNFRKTFEDLFRQKKEDLYEILLIYNTHFKKQINQDPKFFDEFIENTIDNKDFATFQIALSFIKKIEIFLTVIDKYKKKIFENYIKEPKDFGNFIIKIDKNLTLQKEKEEEKKEDSIKTPKKKYDGAVDLSNKSNKDNKRKDEIPAFFKNIGKINEFCSQKKIILIHFTNDFWKYILKSYKNATQENIVNCYELRKIFNEYYKLVDEFVANKKSIIKKEAKNYKETDEFAILLDKSIRKYIENNKDLTNIQKLNYIQLWNPYYKDPKYSTKVNTDIFDLFDLNDIDNTFIVLFKKMQFETIFKDKIDEYIAKLISKIKNIFHFSQIIKLINIKLIENKNKILEPLNRKYENNIKDEIKELNDSNKEKILQIIADFAIFNYIYEEKPKQFDFIEKKI